MTTEEKIAYLESAKLKQESYKARVFAEYPNSTHARNIAVLCDHHIRLMDRDIARLTGAGFSELEKGIQQFASFFTR